MIYLIATLVLGIFLGALLRRRSVKFNDERSMTIPLLLLIFFMGASIGASPDVKDSVVMIGYQSIIFAVLTVLGSVGGALFLRGFAGD